MVNITREFKEMMSNYGNEITIGFLILGSDDILCVTKDDDIKYNITFVEDKKIVDITTTKYDIVFGSNK